jgi:fluoroacetyl-CoA thioesterase
MGVLRHTVTGDDTAIAVGSGDVPVLGTPRLLALAEAVCVSELAPELAEGQTSVGTRAQVEHLAATPVGGSVEFTAQIVHRDGRLRRFDVVASEVLADGRPGRVVGRVDLTRVIVDRERFIAQATEPAPR